MISRLRSVYLNYRDELLVDIVAHLQELSQEDWISQIQLEKLSQSTFF
jgi:hypothetical protein